MDQRWTVIAMLGTMLLGAFASVAQAGKPDASPKKVLRHVVIFKFLDSTSDEEVNEVAQAFAQLPSKIDSIIDFEWGTDVSPEGKADGFTHCFLVTFADEKGRDAYLPHAAHQQFVKLLRPRLEKALVIDYWTR